MSTHSVLVAPELNGSTEKLHETAWAVRALMLWEHRRMLARVVSITLLVSLCIAFTIPKQYKSVASIMPPDTQGSTAMMLAALTAHAPGLGALGSLASSFLGSRSSSALFMDLLRSSTVSNQLVDRFNLQHVYHKHYRVDAAKRLARLTKITEDKKSGVITIAVEDTNRVRARDLAQAYLDELNRLVVTTNTSAAHRERIFIERRLHAVQGSLEQAELELSRFSSRNNAVDIREQTRAIVDAGARLQAQLLVAQSGLESLRQIYGDGNIRVRESEARIASLKAQLVKMTGSSAPLIDQTADTAPAPDDKGDLYPPLRQLPRLAVPYADLYRHVRVQEAVFELLTQQYEVARIEEAKDLPAVSVVDHPGIPEKKSFPPRLLLSLLVTLLSFVTASGLVLTRERWSHLHYNDPRRVLAEQVLSVLRRRVHATWRFGRGAA